jgi:hypothetical protein
MRNITSVLLFAWIILLSSCEAPDIPSQAIEHSELYGRYTGNFGETNINYLDLLQDSVFISYYKTGEGHLYVDTGWWRFFNIGRDYYLEMGNYRRRYPWACDDLKKSVKTRDYEPDSSITTSFILNRGEYGIKIKYCSAQLQYYIKGETQSIALLDYILLACLMMGAILMFILGVIYARRKQTKVPLLMGMMFFGIYSIIIIVCLLILRWKYILTWL